MREDSEEDEELAFSSSCKFYGYSTSKRDRSIFISDLKLDCWLEDMYFKPLCCFTLAMDLDSCLFDWELLSDLMSGRLLLCASCWDL